MMSAAVANKEDKKPIYKDYVSFLGNYKQGKKHEKGEKGVLCSPPSNNSSTSINSDLNEMPTKSFKQYLENYNNKKYNPIQTDFKKKPSPNGEGKIVKTEVFIEINNEQNSKQQISKTVQLNVDGIQDRNVSSCKVSTEECQENIGKHILQFETGTELLQGKVRVDENPQKKMENNVSFKEIKRHPLKKTPSITEKSKLFEKNSANDKTDYRIESATKATSPVKNVCPSPKPVFNKGMPAQILSNDNNIKQKPCRNDVDFAAMTSTKCEQNQFQTEISITDSGSPSSSNIISSGSPPPKNVSCGIPPPPPPPPASNFSSQKLKVSPKPFSTSKAPPNIYSTMPKLQNTRQPDTTDGSAAPTLDKNDPRVKKLVYGALREMYGSYHDKANDYLATLPKNRVKKNNGLDSIINSIASQGGLEKLTGRGNPKVDAE
nr:von Willebrand factor A domain-containing protein DDB_G0292740-like [Leptinotarsa decemlineata]